MTYGTATLGLSQKCGNAIYDRTKSQYRSPRTGYAPMAFKPIMTKNKTTSGRVRKVQSLLESSNWSHELIVKPYAKMGTHTDP